MASIAFEVGIYVLGPIAPSPNARRAGCRPGTLPRADIWGTKRPTGRGQPNFDDTFINHLKLVNGGFLSFADVSKCLLSSFASSHSEGAFRAARSIGSAPATGFSRLKTPRAPPDR